MRQSILAVVSLVTVVAFAGCIAETEPTAPVNDTVQGLPPGTVVEKVTKTWDGSLSPAVQDPAGLTPCGKGGEGVDKKTHEWAFPTEKNGTKLGVKNIVLKLSSGQASVDNDIYFYDPDGEEVASGTSAMNTETVEVPDTLPGGAYKVVVVACTGANSTFKVEAEATIVAL